MQTSYRVEIEEEEGGRFLAEVVDLPGVMAHGETAELALAHAQALALRVLADRLDHDEGPRGPVSVTFETTPAAARAARPGGPMQRSGWVVAVLLGLWVPCASAFTIAGPTASVLSAQACAGATTGTNCSLVGGDVAVLAPPSDADEADFADTDGESSAAAHIDGSLAFGPGSLHFTASATAEAAAAGEGAASASASYMPMDPLGVEIVLDPAEALAITASGTGAGAWQLIITLTSTSIECGTTLGACPAFLQGSDVTPTTAWIAFEYELAASGLSGSSQTRAGEASVLLTRVPEPAPEWLAASALAARARRARRVR